MIKFFLISLFGLLLTGCNQNESIDKQVGKILDIWEEEIPTTQDDIDRYYRPMTGEYADILVSPMVWPSINAYEEIRVLAKEQGNQVVIDSLSREYHESSYPRRNRSVQLLMEIEARDWWGHFSKINQTIDEFNRAEGLEEYAH